MIKQILRETMPGRAARLLRDFRRQRRRLDAFLDENLPDTEQGGGAVVITGPTRIGKTTVGGELCRSLGWRHVQMDGQTGWWHSPDHGAQIPAFLRAREARRVAKRIMVRTGGGAVLDSYLLLSAFAAEPRACAAWVRQGRIVVLSSEAGLEDRLAAMRDYRRTGRCWTSRLTEDQLRQVAQRSVRECRMINDLAARHDFTVHLLDCHAFAASTRDSAGRIGRMLSGAAPGALAAE
ncbi:MAG: hypothetical protein ACXIUV_10260 [Alkalilacustris sp.]